MQKKGMKTFIPGMVPILFLKIGTIHFANADVSITIIICKDLDICLIQISKEIFGITKNGLNIGM